MFLQLEYAKIHVFLNIEMWDYMKDYILKFLFITKKAKNLVIKKNIMTIL